MRSSSTEAFAIARNLTVQSRWHGRLAVVVADENERPFLLDRLRAVAGARLLSSPTRLFSEGVHKIWADYQSTTELGPPCMVDPPTFLALVRELCDSLYDAIAPDAPLLVEILPDPDIALPVLTSVYPDAVVVRTADDIDELLSRAPVAVASQVVRTTLDDSPMRDRLVVIVGCGRSGTTWLESLLMAHPRCGGIEETESFVFHQLEPLWVNLRSGRGLHAHLDADALASALRRFCDGLFLGALTAKPGADYFVEKTPLHIYNLEGMRAVYPDAWYIHLVRDGRDVARSMTQVPFFGLPRVEDAAVVWRRVVETARVHAARFSRFREVRYEQLYADPAGVVTDLLAWVGLTVDDATDHSLAATATRRVSTHAGSANPLGQLRGHGLSRRQLAVVHAVAGRLLVDLGYADAAEHRAFQRHPSYLAAKARRLARRITGRGRG